VAELSPLVAETIEGLPLELEYTELVLLLSVLEAKVLELPLLVLDTVELDLLEMELEDTELEIVLVDSPTVLLDIELVESLANSLVLLSL
jgi:hypothetical protein